MADMKRVYGIDLGTTYSALAFVNEYGKDEIVPNSDSEIITPSVVFFETETNIIVGSVAKESARTDPTRVVTFVKRHIGEKDWAFPLDGKTYTAERISSFILKRLADDAKSTKQHDVADVIITCPAYFNDNEREATRNAGKMAGLNVLHILDEPVAAAFCYGFANTGEDKTAIVYDLGGGTFDVTVVAIKGNEIASVCTDGDHKLGGKNWDERLVNYMVDQYVETVGSGQDMLDDPITAYEVWLRAEKAKQVLSKKGKTIVQIEYAGERPNITLTREKFDALTADLLSQTTAFTHNVLQMAKEKGVTRIDDFLLVGGSSKMPQVKEMVDSEFKSLITGEVVIFEPDHAVAKGAAMFGDKYMTKLIVKRLEDEEKKASGDKELSEEQKTKILETASEITGKTTTTIVTDITTKATTVASKSYGIKAFSKSRGEHMINNLIFKQTALPISVTKAYPLTVDNAVKLELEVFSNDNYDTAVPLDEGYDVGTTVMELVPGMTKEDRIEITFTLTDEGVLTMNARDPKNNNEVNAEFKQAAGVSAEEIAAAQAENAELIIE